jgi:glycosyltransferase involved in cell wall biosynthesis
MHIGLIIYGSLDTLSGGYLYDRKLVEYLRSQGDTVETISLPWRNYAAHLTDNFHFRLPPNLDILIQDELNHPSLIFANRRRHAYAVISLVHHLRCSELRPNWQNAFYQVIEKQYLNSVDGFIFNSRTTQGVVERLLGQPKSGMIGYPPTDRFGAPLSEDEIAERAREGTFRILFLGNVMYRKGLHTLLNALATLSPLPYTLDVVGSLTTEPDYTKQIQQFITKNDLSSFVFLHGSLDKQPLIEKLKHAHVLAVPSSYEGFGIVYLEGMGFGLPAIGTTAGAAGEIIEHGKTGFLIEPDDSRSLAEHLKTLTEDRATLARLSINARARYLRQPSWTETAQSIREYLLSFL